MKIYSVILALIVSWLIYKNVNTEEKVEPKRYIEIVSIAKPVVKEKAKTRVAIKKYARVTKYVWTGFPMANGNFPDTNHVAVSDRSIKLGSIMWVSYRYYTVGDYTSADTHEASLMSGYDLTVDIYTDKGRADAISFGIKKINVALLAIK